jgi:hypothetical protein
MGLKNEGHRGGVCREDLFTENKVPWRRLGVKEMDLGLL